MHYKFEKLSETITMGGDTGPVIAQVAHTMDANIPPCSHIVKILTFFKQILRL